MKKVLREILEIKTKKRQKFCPFLELVKYEMKSRKNIYEI
jgi:hypothetical protein